MRGWGWGESPGTPAEGYGPPASSVARSRGAKMRRVPETDITKARPPRSPFPTRWRNGGNGRRGERPGAPATRFLLPAYSSFFVSFRIFLVIGCLPVSKLLSSSRPPLARPFLFPPIHLSFGLSPHFPCPPGHSRRFQLAGHFEEAQLVSGAPSRPSWPGRGTGGPGHSPSHAVPAGGWSSTPGLAGERDPQRHSHVLKTRSGASGKPKERP